jgi:sugar phosphate isomerase/epimerase
MHLTSLDYDISASLDSIPTSFAFVHPRDSLTDKLRAISATGFKTIGLGFPDLVSFASSRHKIEIKDDDYENQCSVCVEVRKLCAANKLDIMILQSFANFEGWSVGSKERLDAF